MPTISTAPNTARDHLFNLEPEVFDVKQMVDLMQLAVCGLDKGTLEAVDQERALQLLSARLCDTAERLVKKWETAMAQGRERAA